MLLLSALLLLPVILGADQEWRFENYVVKTNENNILTGVEITTTSEIVAELDLSNLGLEGIDSNALDNVTNINSLNLANNWLTTLPEYIFSRCQLLQHLSLADNNISTLHGVFIRLRNLQTLDLSNNQLEHMGEGYLYGLNRDVVVSTKGNIFSNISTLLSDEPYDLPEKTIVENKSGFTENLTILSLDFSKVEVCTENYWHVNLREMSFSDEITLVKCTQVRVNHTDLRLSIRHFHENDWNLINDLPENIVELDLSHNGMHVLRDAVIENLYLRTLIVDHNAMNWVSGNALAKTNLSVLSLNYNVIFDSGFVMTLPSSFEEIRLSHNRIDVIPPDTFSRLKNLVKLDLSHNSIGETAFAKTLPSSLEEIRLGHNRIHVIPPGSFSSLKNLVTLDLSHNGLTNIEAGSFRNLGALRELNLYNNRIYIYKGIFAGVRSIEYLNIGMNGLNETKNILYAMPDTLATVILDSNEIESLGVGSFVRVPKHKLSLKGNNIYSFEEGSFKLPNLEELDLGSNELRQLNQESFIGLANLKQLSLAGNKITSLCLGELFFLRKLEILDLSSNPIKELKSGALENMIVSNRSVVFLSDVPIEIISPRIFPCNRC